MDGSHSHFNFESMPTNPMGAQPHHPHQQHQHQPIGLSSYDSDLALQDPQHHPHLMDLSPFGGPFPVHQQYAMDQPDFFPLADEFVPVMPHHQPQPMPQRHQHHQQHMPQQPHMHPHPQQRLHHQIQSSPQAPRIKQETSSGGRQTKRLRADPGPKALEPTINDTTGETSNSQDTTVDSQEHLHGSHYDDTNPAIPYEIEDPQTFAPDNMPDLIQYAGQMLMVGLNGNKATDEIRQLITKYRVGSIILSSKNMKGNYHVFYCRKIQLTN